jgi:hypothetical protein
MMVGEIQTFLMIFDRGKKKGYKKKTINHVFVINPGKVIYLFIFIAVKEWEKMKNCLARNRKLPECLESVPCKLIFRSRKLIDISESLSP